MLTNKEIEVLCYCRGCLNRKCGLDLERSDIKHLKMQKISAEKFYRFSDYLGTTSQMSELLGISSISGILRFGRYPAYHGISEPHLAVKSSKTVVENRPYY